MKKLTLIAAQSQSPVARGIPRSIGASGIICSLLAMAVSLLGPAGSVRAQFPTAPDDETTYSLGVVRIDTASSTLTPAQLSALFDPVGTAVAVYPGWNVTARTLTSPVLFDSDTRIAVGAVTERSIFNRSGAQGFPQQVGLDGFVSNPPLSLPLHKHIIPSYAPYVTPLSGDFSGIYPSGGNAGPREFLTAIQAFNLQGGPCPTICPPQTAQTCVSNAYPAGADTTMVRAGFDDIYNGGQAFSTPYLDYSLGMMDSQDLTGNPAADFPANSFFDIYPEVTLPPVNNTASLAAIPLVGPGTAVGGAVLTTVGVPLVVEAQNIQYNANSGVPALPPSVVYQHQTTDLGVNLVFRDTCPNLNPNSTPPNQPYWMAGDVLGTLTLAGHNPGVVNPCSKTTAIQAFADAVFGVSGQLAPTAILPMLFGNAKFPPSTSCSYDSAPGTNFDGSSVDVVRFTNGVTIFYVRDFHFTGLINPIDLPAFGNCVTYSNANTALSLDLSTDGVGFITGSATGPLTILICNTNLNSTGTKTYYSAWLTSFTGTGSSQAGSFKIRASPTKNGSGLHIVQANAAGNYSIGGNLTVPFEWSANGGATYLAASRDITVNLRVAVNCGSTSPMLTFAMVSPGVGKLTWSGGGYRLQSTPSFSTHPIVWTDVPVTSPYIFSLTASTPLFYHLLCP